MDRWKGSHCRVYECDDYASRDIDLLPICPRHAWELAQHYQDILTEKARLDAQTQIEKAREVEERGRGNREEPVVYYARIGDYIKIGYTTRLRNRLRTLRVDELLAIEPGHANLERYRHGQFAAERIDLKRENFRPSPELTKHIANLREWHGVPHWASLPRTTEITSRKEQA